MVIRHPSRAFHQPIRRKTEIIIMSQLFGTDGVRGQANVAPMTPDVIVKLAQATVHHMMAKCPISEHGDHRFTVVMGKDTRLSGYMVEASLMAGFVSKGVDVILLGPLPTPAVAMLTRSLRANMGVMISASHNHFDDNGIKFFNHEGFKLSTNDEQTIERFVDEGVELSPSSRVGRAKRLDDALGRYIEFAKATFPRGQRLDGLRIVVDCANGAAYKAAPRIFWELGAEVISLACDPNGLNINLNCGATSTALIRSKVLEHKADIGICLDGDADRLMVIDENGMVLDGDQLIALITSLWQKDGRLKSPGVVGTVMSNLGLERYLEPLGIKLHRAGVGDRFVLEMMQEKMCNVGGEQSGHIILSDYTTTGDGIIAALQILSLMTHLQCRASDMGKTFERVPQILKNIRTTRRIDCDASVIKKSIAHAQKTLGENGRVLVRPSGTETLVRIMLQGDDAKLLEQLAHDIALSVEKTAAE